MAQVGSVGSPAVTLGTVLDVKKGEKGDEGERVDVGGADVRSGLCGRGEEWIRGREPVSTAQPFQEETTAMVIRDQVEVAVGDILVLPVDETTALLACSATSRFRSCFYDGSEDAILRERPPLAPCQ